MNRKPESLKRVLENVLLKKGIKKDLQINRLRGALMPCFTEAEFSQIRLSYIKKKKLIIYVKSSSLLYEFKCFRKESMLEALKKLGNPRIDDIQLILETARNGGT